MITYIKSSLDRIKAEDELIQKTSLKLHSTLKQQRTKTSWFMKGSRWNMKKIVAVSCAVVFACGLTIGGYAYNRRPVAYLSLDINPSVELGVNSAGKVVSADGYNADGKTILKGENLNNTDVKTAVDDLVKAASSDGFISSDGSTVIAITSETDDSNEAKQLEDTAEQGANDALTSADKTAVVYTTNVALARRDEARKLGITPGKLNLIQKLLALDPTATVDQYKDAKVTDIMKKIIALKKAGAADTGSGTAGNTSSAAGSSSGTVISSDTAASSATVAASSEDENDNAKIEKAVTQSVQNANRKAVSCAQPSSAAPAAKSNNGQGKASTASSKSNGNSKAGQNQSNAAASGSKASVNNGNGNGNFNANGNGKGNGNGNGSIKAKTTVATTAVSAAPVCSKTSANANANVKASSNANPTAAAKANDNGKEHANSHSAIK